MLVSSDLFFKLKSVFMHEIFSSCKALYLKTANLN